jgi:hypothetical protein
MQLIDHRPAFQSSDYKSPISDLDLLAASALLVLVLPLRLIGVRDHHDADAGLHNPTQQQGPRP